MYAPPSADDRSGVADLAARIVERDRDPVVALECRQAARGAAEAAHQLQRHARSVPLRDRRVELRKPAAHAGRWRRSNPRRRRCRNRPRASGPGPPSDGGRNVKFAGRCRVQQESRRTACDDGGRAGGSASQRCERRAVSDTLPSGPAPFGERRASGGITRDDPHALPQAGGVERDDRAAASRATAPRSDRPRRCAWPSTRISRSTTRPPSILTTIASCRARTLPRLVHIDRGVRVEPVDGRVPLAAHVDDAAGHDQRCERAEFLQRPDPRELGGGEAGRKRRAATVTISAETACRKRSIRLVVLGGGDRREAPDSQPAS